MKTAIYGKLAFSPNTVFNSKPSSSSNALYFLDLIFVGYIYWLQFDFSNNYF
ncbi:hypothetical protein Pint_14765 [Pistacia integerrima]|uniref:Uncharacterized protein n=1 Tax=Pistacia integerrima TaxID=434235 RepID=A0ACC0Y490_9ROSI|nr:hypothetical protein Pint_14765 [Pistacia integerrima]